MEPVTLAVITSSVVALASKVIEGAASEAGKKLWDNVQKLMRFDKTPSAENLAQQVAMRLKDDEVLASKVLKAIQAEPKETASKLINQVDAEKVIIIGQQHIEGDLNIEM